MMNRDFIFFGFIIALAIWGVYHTQQSKDDILFRDKPSSNDLPPSDPVEPSYHIEYEKLASPNIEGGHVQDVGQLAELYDEYSNYDPYASELENAEEEESQGENSITTQQLKKENTFSWYGLFDRWSLQLADNITNTTNLQDVVSSSECSIRIKVIEKETAFSEVQNLKTEIKKNTLYISSPDSFISITNPRSVKQIDQGLKTLIKYCKQFPKADASSG